MNIIQKIKLFLAARATLKEATTMNGVKPGWKTSEFYLVVFSTTIPTLIGAANGMIPPKWATIILAASSAVYGLIRAITKATATPTTAVGDTNVTVKAS